MKPLAEVPPPARFTNVDLLRGFGLASTARKGQTAQTKEEGTGEEEVVPLPASLGFAVCNGDDAAPGGGGGGLESGAGKEGLPLSNGLSFAVYQDNEDVGEAHECKDGVDKKWRGDGGSVFANGLSFSVYVDDDDDAAPGAEEGGDIHDDGLPLANGLGFSVYQDDDTAAGVNDGNAGRDSKGGAGEGLAFSNGLGFAAYRDGDNGDAPAAAAVGSSSSAPCATAAPVSAGASASSSASGGLGFHAHEDKGSVVGGGADHAGSAGKLLWSESGRPLSGRGGGFGDGGDRGGARGVGRRDGGGGDGGDGGSGGSDHRTDGGGGGGGRAGGRTTTTVGGGEEPVARHPRDGDALFETGESGLRNVEVSFFEDPILGDAEGGDGSEDTAGGLSALRFFDDSTVSERRFCV